MRSLTSVTKVLPDDETAHAMADEDDGAIVAIAFVDLSAKTLGEVGNLLLAARREQRKPGLRGLESEEFHIRQRTQGVVLVYHAAKLSPGVLAGRAESVDEQNQQGLHTYPLF